MKKFRVTLYKSVTVTVDAESEDDAKNYIFESENNFAEELYYKVDEAFKDAGINISDIWEEK